jgi:hypothetical protein
MQVTVNTGATPGSAAMAGAPAKYHLSFDLSEPLSHLGERMEGVFRTALDYATDGITSIAIKMSEDTKVDLKSELIKVGVGTALVGVGGTLAAGVGEFNDLMSNAHSIPTTSWASYRNVSFIGIAPDDGNSSTPPTFLYQMGNGMTVATSRTGMNFNDTNASHALVGTRFANLMHGNGGNDTITAGSGNDRIWGGEGNDKAYGQNGNDVFSMGSGNDYASGGSGNDTLNGNTGRDRLNGGSGEDKYYIDGYDTLDDFHFVRDQHDHIAASGNSAIMDTFTQKAVQLYGTVAYQLTSMTTEASDFIYLTHGDVEFDGWSASEARAVFNDMVL